MRARVETVRIDDLPVRLHTTAPAGLLRTEGAPTVVLVHGIGMSHRSFDRSQPLLAARFRTVSVDLPGFGGLPPAGRRLSMAELGDLVVRAVRAHGAGDLVLVGQSMGTQVVAEAARMHPDVVRAVVLVGPVVEAGRRSLPVQALALGRDGFVETPRMNAVLVTDYLRSMRQYVRELRPMIDHRIEDTVAGLRQPVLVLRGTQDPIARHEWAARLADVAPHGRLVELQGPHHVQQRQPVDFVRLVAETVGAGDAARTDGAARPWGSASAPSAPGAPSASSQPGGPSQPAGPSAPGGPAGVEPTARNGEPTSATGTVPPDRVPLVRRARWAALDWWYAAVWQLRSLGPTTADDYRSGDRQAVVVIPGVYETWHFMRPLMDALHDRGHPVHVLPVLRHNVRPVPDAAREVLDHLEEHDLRAVLLVAHSKGGLIGKYAMTRLDDRGRIDRMVAVSTPFAGSGYARLAPVRHLRAFRAADPVLSGLARELDVNTRITSVYGVFDTLIPEGSALVGATNVRLPVGGHFRILADERTRAAVLAAADPEG